MGRRGTTKKGEERRESKKLQSAGKARERERDSVIYILMITFE